MNGVRRIFRSSSTSNAEIRELLESLFAAELLAPSRCLWLVSPWLSDLHLLDNRAGAFSALDPQWGSRQLRLADLLGRNADGGSDQLLARIKRAVPDAWLESGGGTAVHFDSPSKTLIVAQPQAVQFRVQAALTTLLAEKSANEAQTDD